MSTITNTKPEPISAIPNWHYDSYFLAQLQRINPRKSGSAPEKQRILITRKTEMEIGVESEGNV
ncbi:MAG: hypothetical protein ABSB19_11870 [Methylomonas sp.]|jgi:hypothetical protein